MVQESAQRAVLHGVSMGQVIDFLKSATHEESETCGRGEAFCLACASEWEAVAPVGTVELECPECHTHKGRFKFAYSAPEAHVWMCNCGNQLFNITPDGTFCPNCGTYQNF